MGEPTDRQLWEDALAGDGDAFGALFTRHAKAIYNYCFRRTADWSAAEELTSAVFLEAWRRREDVRLVDESVLPWLYVVGGNLLRNRRRRLHRHRHAVSRLPVPREHLDEGDELADRLDDERAMRRIHEVVRTLRPEEQEVFVLCAWQGLSYEDVAAALDIPVGTVRSRLARARARLRGRLGDSSGGASAAVRHEVGGGAR